VLVIIKAQCSNIRIEDSSGLSSLGGGVGHGHRRGLWAECRRYLGFAGRVSGKGEKLLAVDLVMGGPD
jgi:hypothetical protein